MEMISGVLPQSEHKRGAGGRKDKPIPELLGGQDLQIGSKLRIARQGKGISISELVNKTGYKKGTLSGVENNHTLPGDELLKVYEEILGLEPGTFIGSFIRPPRPTHHFTRLPKDLIEVKGGFKIGKEVETIFKEFHLPQERREQARKLILASTRAILRTIEDEVMEKPESPSKSSPAEQSQESKDFKTENL